MRFASLTAIRYFHPMFLRALFVVLVAFPAWAADEADFFRTRIEPILVSNCLECHGAERKGGLDLRTKATALTGSENGVVIQPGDPAGSKLIDLVSASEMPPKKPLAPEDVAALREWIETGAYFPDRPLDPFAITTNSRAGYDWWSLQALDDSAPPAIENAPRDWARNPIDAYILATLHEKGLSPSLPATPRVLIRRATYDLLGLPPSPEEVDAFVAACAEESGSADRVGEAAYRALLDRLLASPHYGEQWGRHWLDIVRFGESAGFEVNHIIDDLWPYRDYVIKAFNDDRPFDEVMVEHLAGDAVGYGDPETEIAMAFLVAGPWDIVGNQDPVQAAQIRANTVDEMIRATGEAFIGLTVGCARCHDHKFDPISQKDYYQWYATLAGVNHDTRVVASQSRREEHAAAVKPINAKRDALRAERDAFRKAILERAESHAQDYEAEWTRDPISRHKTEERFDPVEVRFVRLVSEGRDTDPNARTGYKIDEFEVWTDAPVPRNVAAAAQGGKATGTSRTAKDFADAYQPALTIDGKFGETWMGDGPELTVELAEPATVHRVIFSSDRKAELNTKGGESAFLCEYRIEVSTDGETWTTVADSHARKPVNDRHRNYRFMREETTDAEHSAIARLDKALREVDGELRKIPGLRRLRVGRLTQLSEATHVMKGGDPQRKGDEVFPASLSALSGESLRYALEPDAAEREGRLALARWIVAPENPLTPRVLANRLWHYHFGTGIVHTPSDFGFMGGRPSHPKLLDFLARELTAPDGTPWRLKAMHRLIMLSQTYRQSSVYRARAAEVDTESRSLWRFPPRRLTGEELRDTMLMAAGKLDTRMGGPGFRLYAYLRDNVSTYVPLDSYSPETYRRSVYHQNVRASRIDLMTDFDTPDCALSAPRRVTTTTPTQALTLMNHQFTTDMAQALADRVATETRAVQVDRIFALLYNRSAETFERDASETFIETHGMQAFCRAMLNTNELIYLD